MSRWAWCALAVLALASRVHAQAVPAPPPAYASASIGLDLVLEPLATAAETDLANGEITLALARTQTVLAEVPAASSVHVRAEGLSLLAHQRLGDTPPGTVDTDAAFAPLVTAASEDVTASRFDLSRARLAWVLAHVPAESALALRARAVSAALEVRAGAASVATTTAPTTVYVPPATSTWSPRPVVDPERAVAPSVAVDDGHRPRRRQDLEIVDLYITSGLMGAYFGAWISESSGLLSGASSDDQSRIVSIAMIAGAGVLTLGAFGLDQIDDGPRSGQPTSIAAGMRFGFVLSGLTLGLLSADNSFSTAEAFDFMGVGLIGGTALGAVFAYAAEPHPSQVQFTQASGVWGAILGAELGAFVAPLAFPNFGATTDRQQTGFGLTLGGLGAGLLTGIALSAAHEHFSSRRSWLTTLGLLGGTAAGTLVWLLVSAASHWTFDLATWGGVAGVGSIAGMILAAALTSGDTGARDWDGPSAVQLSVSPTMGGATIGVSGGF